MAPVGSTASGPADKAPLFTTAFLALALSELAYFTAFGVMVPVVPLYAAEALGAGPIGAGLAVGVFSITALVLRPFAGRMSDRRGRRPLLITGGLLFTLITVAHLVATPLPVLIVLRALLGVAEAMFFVAAGAALTDLAPPDRLGEAVSYISLALYLGIAVGPSLGEWWLHLGGYPAAWLGGAGLALVATLLALRIPETADLVAGIKSGPLIERSVIGPGLAFFAGLAGAAGFTAFAALHARNLGMTGSGVVFAVYGAVVITGRVLFAKVTDRVPPLRLTALSLVACALGLGLISALPNPAGFMIGAGTLAVGVTFLTPAFFRAAMSRVPPDRRGTAIGTASMFVDTGLGGGPILLGPIASAAGIPAAFAAGSALAAVGAVTTTFLRANRRRVKL